MFTTFSIYITLIPHRPPQYTLFPYTTLFRSTDRGSQLCHRVDRPAPQEAGLPESRRARIRGAGVAHAAGVLVCPPTRQVRSEEHTSELQSLRHLVCRLLLEKKKRRTKCIVL